MARKKSSSDYEAQALNAALDALNKQEKGKETEDSIEDYGVRPNVSVSIVTSDFRKFRFSWSDLDLKDVPASALPENTLAV